jgi:hypothetical protein
MTGEEVDDGRAMAFVASGLFIDSDAGRERIE